MADRADSRKEAYHYICHRLGLFSVMAGAADDGSVIPLDELESLKDGVADPSPELVALARRLFCSAVGDAEIDAHLVTPFKNNS